MISSIRFFGSLLGVLCAALSTVSATPTYTSLHAFADAGTSAVMLLGSDGALYVASSSMGSNGGGQLFRINGDGTGYALVKACPSASGDPLGPIALVEDASGVLYGASYAGGASGSTGTIFKVNKDATGFAVLHSFTTTSLGTAPSALILASDGALYGMTSNGGVSNKGVLFKIATDGTGYSVIRYFNGEKGSALIEGPGGALYWTTTAGGAYGYGMLIKMNKDGTGYTVIKNFAGSSDGATPRCDVVVASDGKLYGTTSAGGSSSRGLAFRIDADGTSYTVLHNFLGNASDGGAPYATLTEGPDGMMYGTTNFYGAGNRGTVFRMNKDGTGYSVLKTFSAGTSDGGNLAQSVRIAPDGTLYGCNAAGGGDTAGLLFRLNSDGTGFAVLKDLRSPDGSLPLAPVMEASDGALYGSTYVGGGATKGTLFKVNKDGTGFTVLHRFTTSTDGVQPSGKLTEASDGALYGATLGGGAYSGGVLFKLNKDGTGYTILRSFASTSTDGSGLLGGVIEGSDGALYGTTDGGGTSSAGTIFKINKDGTGYAVLRSFTTASSDGHWPYAGLIEAPSGILYGTTIAGGSANLGVAFKIQKNGTGFTILHSFSGGTGDGASPYSGVYLASDGRLYGTTTAGGSANLGTVYGLNADGTGYAVIKQFAGGTGDGSIPYYGSVVELGGVLYGTTETGGSYDSGTVFGLNKDGTGFSVLVNLGVDQSDGRVPGVGPIAGSDGLLYGTTAYGAGGGTVFSCSTY